MVFVLALKTLYIGAALGSLPRHSKTIVKSKLKNRAQFAKVRPNPQNKDLKGIIIRERDNEKRPQNSFAVTGLFFVSSVTMRGNRGNCIDSPGLLQVS